MNEFITDFIEKIRNVQSENDLREMYRWLFTKQHDVANTAAQINNAFNLQGDLELKPDLLCLNVGASNGMVVLAANPGWSLEDNAREDAFCRNSVENYEDLIFNFFDTHPKVVGRRVRWWSGPINFSRELMPEYCENRNASAQQKWQAVNKSKTLGGWELFPWHSISDGISPQIKKSPWLHEFCKESILALIRLQPKIILVASKEGYDLVRRDLLDSVPWSDSTIGQKTSVAIAYTRIKSGCEIIAIRRQIFASFKVLTNQEIFDEIERLRRGWK
ncbi:MAG: hypothetical protein ACO25T_09290 [Arenimonas sp.]|uniref:hypothetical protein n=1 Tax=Arenimonas sp. TaxID=1872635 RepID=UPI003BFDDE5B